MDWWWSRFGCDSNNTYIIKSLSLEWSQKIFQTNLFVFFMYVRSVDSSQSLIEPIYSDGIVQPQNWNEWSQTLKWKDI